MFKQLKTELMLYYFIYSGGRFRSAERIFPIMYLVKHVMGYDFEYPPYYSSQVEEDVRKLAAKRYLSIEREGGELNLVPLASEPVRLLMEEADSYVVSRSNVVMRVRDMMRLMKDLRFQYDSYDVKVLLSIAMYNMARELEYLGEKRMLVKILDLLSAKLGRSCECLLG